MVFSVTDSKIIAENVADSCEQGLKGRFTAELSVYQCHVSCIQWYLRVLKDNLNATRLTYNNKLGGALQRALT